MRDTHNKVLLQFKHGLGDALQFQICIRHLKLYNPNWTIGVECPASHVSCFVGIADAVHVMQRPFDFRQKYSEVLHMPWELISGEHWSGVPSTKPSLCLERYFPNLNPDPQLYVYEMHPGADAIARVAKYRKEVLEDQPYGIVHYEGTHSPETKNLSDWEAYVLCDHLASWGLVPVVLSWSGWKNPLFGIDWIERPSNGHWLWEDKGQGNADTIYELIKHAEYMFGIDSGPEHLAGATNTPTSVFTFSDKFPARCFDLCDNIFYHVHESAQDWVPDDTMQFFLDHYHHDWIEGSTSEAFTAYIERFEEKMNEPDEVEEDEQAHEKTPVDDYHPQELSNFGSVR